MRYVYKMNIFIMICVKIADTMTKYADYKTVLSKYV